MAICDVDKNLFEAVKKKHFTEKVLKRPINYLDMRMMFEDKDIDPVSIVTPNHWYTLVAILAIQAGKHVSVEKPCSYNIYEGQKLLETASKYDVIVLDGVEQRSNPWAQSAAKFLQECQLEEVYMAMGFALSGGTR